MPILGDYDGDTSYLFSANGGSVGLKQGAFYNYTGFGEALVMDVYLARLTVVGQLSSGGTGVRLSSGAGTILVAASGIIAAGDGAGIKLIGSGSAEIDNYGVISGAYGIAGFEGSVYARIYNSGTIQADGGEGIAINLGDGFDRIVNTGTIAGSVLLGDGNDVIDTHLGIVTGRIEGGAGNDTYIIAAGQTVGEYDAPGDYGGYDAVTSYADYSLPKFVEYLALAGAAKIGRGNALDNTISGNDNGDRLFGGGGDDYLTAGAGDDVLRGGAGDDQLSSSEGADSFFGGTGDDVVVVGLDPVKVDGGDGLDVVAFLANDAAIQVDLTLAKPVKGGAAALDQLTSIEGVWGSEFADVLSGDANANSFNGYVGNDVINGFGGDDVIDGFDGADALDGGDGIDTVSYAYDYAGVTINLAANAASGGTAAGDTIAGFENVRGGNGNDTLIGSTAANVLQGGDGDDKVSGGGGADTIEGGIGADTLTGGGARDVFLFRDAYPKSQPPSPGGFGTDTITDFQDGIDRISFVGDSGVHSFADLTVSQDGAATVIAVGTFDRITLLNFTAANLTAADVIFG